MVTPQNRLDDLFDPPAPSAMPKRPRPSPRPAGDISDLFDGGPSRVPAASSRSASAPAVPSVDPRLDEFVGGVTARASELSAGQYTYKLGSGGRTPAEQAEKVAGGFSKTLNSKHLSGRGRDVLAFDAQGNYITDGHHEAYQRLGEAYREKASTAPVLVTWGGDWKDFYDASHFELDEDGGAQSVSPIDDLFDPAPADDEVVKTDATLDPARAAPTLSMPPLPSSDAPDVRTMEGRATRDAGRAIEASPHGRKWIDVKLPAGVRDWNEVSSNDAAKETARQWAAGQGIEPAFVESWLAGNAEKLNLHWYEQATGEKREPIDFVGTPFYDEEKRTIRVSAEMPHLKKLEDDYKLAQFKASGIPGADEAVSLNDISPVLRSVTDEETSPGEKLLAVAEPPAKFVVEKGARGLDLATRPLQAIDAGFWAAVKGADNITAVKTAWQQFYGEHPELGKNAVAEMLKHSDRLKAINPRLPTLLGELANLILEPSNLILLGAGAKLLRGGEKVGALAKGAEAGLLDRARPLGIEAAKALRDEFAGHLDDVGNEIERLRGLAADGEDVGAELAAAQAERSHYRLLTEQLDTHAEELRAVDVSRTPAGNEALAHARDRAAFYDREAANASSRAARENAAALADDYRAEAARLEGGDTPAAAAEGFDLSAPSSTVQPLHPSAAPASPLSRAARAVSDVVQLPKAKAGFDLSATGRQGLAQILAHPTYFKQAMAEQVKAFASEDAFNAFAESIRSRPDFDLLSEHVDLSSTGGIVEEAFASGLVKKIPGVRASDRAYSAALDSIRVQAWDNYTLGLADNPHVNADTYKAIGELINISTGRGKIAILDRSELGRKVIDALNVPFFSPRNTAGKFNLLSPVRLVRNAMDPATRPVAWLQMRDATRGLAVLGTTLGLLEVAGLDVGVNPFKPDFGKLRVGKAVFDLTGGEGATVRYLAQMARSFGDIEHGRKPQPYQTPLALTTHYLRSQLQPAAAVAVDKATGETFEGKPFTYTQAAADIALPFVLADATKGFEAEGLIGAAKSLPSVVGVGVNFYDKPEDHEAEKATRTPTLTGAVADEAKRLHLVIPSLPKTISTEGLTGDRVQAHTKGGEQLAGLSDEEFAKMKADYAAEVQRVLDETISNPDYQSFESDESKRKHLDFVLKEHRARFLNGVRLRLRERQSEELKKLEETQRRLEGRSRQLKPGETLKLGDAPRPVSQTKPAHEEIRRDVARADHEAEPTFQPFPDDLGALDVPRASMPQVKSEHRGAMVQFLKGRGITHEQGEIAPRELHPTQAEFSPEKVAKARTFTGTDRSILVSADNHVLDGHHQWLAKLHDAPGVPIPIIRLNAPIQHLLVEAARFPSSGVDDASA